MPIIVTVANLKGGVGKSTICALLGVAAHRGGLNTLWVDSDIQGTLSLFASHRESGPTLMSVISSNSLTDALNTAKSDSSLDIVFVDTRPVVENDVITALNLSDAVIIPLRAAPADLAAVQVTHEVCKRIDLPFRFVINDSRPTRLRSEAIIALSKLGPISEMLTTRASYERMIGTGVSPLDGGNDRTGRNEVEALWEDIESWLGVVIRNQGAVSK